MPAGGRVTAQGEGHPDGGQEEPGRPSQDPARDPIAIGEQQDEDGQQEQSRVQRAAVRRAEHLAEQVSVGDVAQPQATVVGTLEGKGQEGPDEQRPGAGVHERPDAP